MFGHILCPTDMKERSRIALEKAVRIAHPCGGKITLLNAHDEFMNKEERSMLRVSFDGLREKYRQIALAAREEMRCMVEGLDDARPAEMAYVLREGKPGPAIVKAAADLAVDLIVICTDGRDNIGDFIQGTITEWVVNHSPCPVLVIPHRE